MALKTSIFIRCCLVGSGQCLRKYQSEVPNGNRIPNPCNPGSIWEGVGHENHEGGGPRNPFGIDFKDAGYKWTKALCEKDSDGDGQSNGLEMGDPECVWSVGSTPSVIDPSKLSHPGLCKPLDSALCRQKNVFLQECAFIGLTTPPPDSWCPEINDPGVKMMEYRYPKLTMSGAETEYKCMIFDFPSDQDYEVIVWDIIVDNREIFHHTGLYACDYDPSEWNPNVSKNMTTDHPVDCRMTPPCGTLFIVWAYGQAGQCYSKEYGGPFGKNSWHRAILQHHYNNDRQIAGLTDSSGIRFWYQPKSRPNNKAVLGLGQEYVIIPPKTPLTWIPSSMSGSCTKRLFVPDQPYYLSSMLIHTHKIGSFVRFALNKHKAGYTILIVNETVEYDRPRTAIWQGQHQIMLEPGDSIEFDCGFNSMSRNDWTFYGSRTNDEMCYAFIDIYPQPNNRNFLMPTTLGEYDWCEGHPEPDMSQIGDCNRLDFQNNLGLVWPYPASEIASELINSCACWGPENYPAQTCSYDCFQAIEKSGVMNEPCADTDQLFQSIMRGWYDDAEIVHRAHSQMLVCKGLKQAPKPGTGCELSKDNNAPKSNFPQQFVLLLTMVIAFLIHN